MSQQLVQIKDEQNSIQMITHLAKSFGYGRKGSKNLNMLLSSLQDTFATIWNISGNFLISWDNLSRDRLKMEPVHGVKGKSYNTSFLQDR